MDTTQIELLRKSSTSGLFKGPQLLLMVLCNTRGLGWATADLAHITGMSLPCTAMAKRSLSKRGMIVQHCPHRDQRVSKIYLTDKGKAEAAQYWNLLRGLTEAEQQIRGADPTQKLGTAS